MTLEYVLTCSIYSAGAGAEWMSAHNWSIRGEYLYVDLGKTTVRELDPVNFPGQFIGYRFGHDMHIARGALNHHF